MLCPLFSQDHFLEQTSLALTDTINQARKVPYKGPRSVRLFFNIIFLMLCFFFSCAFCVKKRAFLKSLIHKKGKLYLCSESGLWFVFSTLKIWTNFHCVHNLFCLLLQIGIKQRRINMN